MDIHSLFYPSMLYATNDFPDTTQFPFRVLFLLGLMVLHSTTFSPERVTYLTVKVSVEGFPEFQFF